MRPKTFFGLRSNEKCSYEVGELAMTGRSSFL